MHRTQHSCARAHRDRETHRYANLRTQRQLVRKDACTLTEEQWGLAQPWSPPPSHLQDGFPARCSYHAPNKSQLIRTLPLNRSPPLGCDQISTRGRKRKPPALSSDSCCAAAPAEELPAGLQPLPPLSIMRGSQAGDRPLLRFGFQLGELQPRAA